MRLAPPPPAGLLRRPSRLRPSAAAPELGQLSALALGLAAVAGFAAARPRDDASAQGAAELFALLQKPRSDSEEASVTKLVAALCAAPQQAPKLTSGRFVACWSSGALAWRAFAPSLSAVQAGQDFNVNAQTVENFVDVGLLRIRAYGSYAPSAQQPADYVASISGGEIRLGALCLSLPIAGEGKFEVVFSDSQLRVFRSSSGAVVQVREDLLAGK